MNERQRKRETRRETLLWEGVGGGGRGGRRGIQKRAFLVHVWNGCGEDKLRATGTSCRFDIERGSEQRDIITTVALILPAAAPAIAA